MTNRPVSWPVPVALLAVAVLAGVASCIIGEPEATPRLPLDRPMNVHVDWRGPWPTTTTSTTTTSTTTSTTVAAPVAGPAAPEPSSAGAGTRAPQHDHEDESPPLGQGDAELVSIRACESGGDYSYDDGTYTGAYNYLDSTWQSAGGSTAQAKDASPAEQDQVTRDYIASGHRGAWPNC